MKEKKIVSESTHQTSPIPAEQWHRTVLLEEAVAWLSRPESRHLVDGTVGGGGHTSHLLANLPEIRVLGIDRDPEALAQARGRVERFGARVELRLGSYAEIDLHLKAAGFPEQVDGILLDLGVNSRQLDDGTRGFSFRFDGPLDMRFHPGGDEPTAADLVNSLSAEELAEIFWRWGEERRSRQAARAIVAQREVQPFSTTFELRECLYRVLGRPQKHRKKKSVDPATLCFQALRIAVNEELLQLERFLERFMQWLRPGGRIAIISFHSLEDRLVKWRLRDLAKGCDCPPELPMCVCGKEPTLRVLTRRPVGPSEEEIEQNPRARSAKMRVAEKLVDS